MYHLQIIKWLSLHKISFGLSNLEIRLGFNSSWHSIVAMLNLNILKFSSKYYLSAIIFGVVIYEIIQFREGSNYYYNNNTNIYDLKNEGNKNYKYDE